MMNSLSAPKIQYATGIDVVLGALQSLLPPERVSVADYAARNRWLANSGGGYVGLWSHTQAPFLTEPMDVLTSPDFLSCAIVGPGQCGKSEIPQNWLLQSACTDPGDMLWYSATEFLVSSFVKTRINPMIEMHDGLRDRLGKSSAENSLSFKRFGSMGVQFLPGTHSTMISKSAPRIVGDEWDAICQAVGDAKTLLDVRRQTFGNDSMLLAMSHPDLARDLDERGWTDGIMAMFRDSDRRLWFWECPECGAFSSPNPTAARVMTLHYDVEAPIDEIADMTRLVCPVNGCLIEDHQRRAMNLTGRWVGKGQSIDEQGIVTGELIRRDTAGFWIVGIMSPFILGGIGALASRRVQAERDFEVTGENTSLKQVMIKQWGIPLERRRRVGEIDANAIADRAEPSLNLGEVPNGVRFITCGIDVQPNRFEILTRGWGIRGESWIVDFRRVEADTSVSPSAWDDLIEFALGTQWPLADGSGRFMRARLAGFDSAGAPGVTQQAYDAWRRARSRRVARNLGKLDGRDCWTLMPLKGASGPQAARLQVVYPDSARKDRTAGAFGQVPLGVFNPNLFKDDLGGQLDRIEAGAWAVHIPAALRSASSPHAWFEQLVAERRLANGTWRKISPNARNEAIDLMVANHVLAFLTGINRIDWARPPVWAAEWDINSNVGVIAPPAPASDEVAAVAPAAASNSPGVRPEPYNPAARRAAFGQVRVIDSVPMRGH
jgi:phage terminase large subunit GpA-like protein